MDEKELQEFDLDDIMREFGDHPEQEDVAEDLREQIRQTVEAAPVEEKEEEVTSDTIRMDTIRVDKVSLPKGKVRGIEPVAEEELPVREEITEETFTGDWEPEYEQPMGAYTPPQPIVFHPRSRLRELKRKLVAGPEKRYYAISEQGFGKLQAAIFISVLVVLICAGSTVMYGMAMVQENRMRLMVFSQFFAMLVSALLAYNQMIEGVGDLLRKRFTLNTLLVFTFLVCCVDGILCLRQLRVPCCAAFSLQATMSLWSTYQRRNAEMGQMDTMRKANHLNSVGISEEYYDGKKGLLRGEGQVEDFMDHYAAPGKPEKVLSVYALVALCVSIALGVTAGVLHGFSEAIQVCAVSLLAAMPATAFITVSRPFAVLERRLHALGTVLCGWRGVKGLCGKAVFPLEYEDLFPAGSVRMNGVKFFGSRMPDQVVAYTTAVIVADGNGLAPLFNQVLDSRNGRHYDAYDLCDYENGGIGGIVENEAVLVGSLSFLKEMGVEVPEGIRVNQAVCVAIDGILSGVFAMTYEKERASAAGLNTLCGYRGLKPVLTAGDFALGEGFIRSKFGVNPRKILMPERAVRDELRQKKLEQDAQALLLTTTEGLAPVAYGVTGARALQSAVKLGVTVHMIGGIVGLAMMLVLTLLGAFNLLTPVNMFLYQLVWMIPGLLITEWTRTI